MIVSRWGNSLAVRLPKEVVDKLGLKEGDDLSAEPLPEGALILRRNDDRQQRREEAVKRLAALARPLPPGYRFDRDEIYDPPRGWRGDERREADDKP